MTSRFEKTKPTKHRSTNTDKCFDSLITVAVEEWKVELCPRNTARKLLQEKRRNAKFLEAQRREEEYWASVAATKTREQRLTARKRKRKTDFSEQEKQLLMLTKENSDADDQCDSPSVLMTSERVFAKIVETAEKSALLQCKEDNSYCEAETVLANHKKKKTNEKKRMRSQLNNTMRVSDVSDDFNIECDDTAINKPEIQAKKKKSSTQQEPSDMNVPKTSKRVGGRRVPVSKSKNRRQKIAKERAQEAKEAVDYSIAARDATRERYNKGDVFESDNVFVMQHKNAETEDVFVRNNDKTASQVMTGEELQRVEDIENPEAAALREKELQDRLEQLESALPETVRKIDNLSEVHRQGERRSNEKFTGSLVNYVFKVQAEVEKAGAREMKERNQQEWVNWLEKMYRRHQPFSDDHYKLFRRLCEGNLADDPLWFKQLVLRRMVEKKRITLEECNKLGSEYTTIKTMYPAMRQQVEARRNELKTKPADGASKKEDNDSDDIVSVFVGEATYRDDGGDSSKWRWWSENATPSQKTLPQTLLQWCTNVRFHNEKKDLDSIKTSDIEVFCCATECNNITTNDHNSDSDTKSTETGKRIRFLTAGNDVDDVRNGYVTDKTLKHWLNFGKQPVQNVDTLRRDAHIFLLNRVDDNIENWTVECFNVCKENENAFAQWETMWKSDTFATDQVESDCNSNENQINGKENTEPLQPVATTTKE